MNWATGIVLAIVIAVFAAIILGAIRNRRRGKASCACSCGVACYGCPMRGKCRREEPAAPDLDAARAP